MLPFLVRSRGPKRARSHRNTVSFATGEHDHLLRSFRVEGYIRLLRDPNAMEQDCQLTCHRDHCFIPGLLTASGSQMQAPLSKRCVLSVRAEDIAGTLDQQTSQVDVAGPRDAELSVQ
jgi:hypothetical protein